MSCRELVQFLTKRHVRFGRRGFFRMRQGPGGDVAGVKRHHQKSRQEPGEKNLDDRNVRRDRIDDHGDRRWNENSQRSRAGERSERDHLVVAAFFQFRQRDLGDGRAGRGRGAGHRTENPARKHVDVHQPSGNPVKPGRKSTKHLLGESGAKKDFPHPDEKRQCGERPRIAVAPDCGGEDGAGRNATADELHADVAGRHQRHRDPHAAGEKDRQKYKKQCGNADELRHFRHRSEWLARRLPPRSAVSASRSAADCPAGH